MKETLIEVQQDDDFWSWSKWENSPLGLFDKLSENDVLRRIVNEKTLKGKLTRLNDFYGYPGYSYVLKRVMDIVNCHFNVGSTGFLQEIDYQNETYDYCHEWCEKEIDCFINCQIQMNLDIGKGEGFDSTHWFGGEDFKWLGQFFSKE